MRRAFILLGAVITIFGVAASAGAQDSTLAGVQDYLDRISNSLDENRLMGKVRFSPYVAQRVVFDDNIWLNDEDEPDTRGRQWDVISDSTIRLGLVLPVNRQYSKFFETFFGRDELTLLSYEVRFLEFSRRGYTDSINQHIRSDLFGFLEDLFSVAGEGRHLTFDVGAEYSDVSDPIDILIRDLNIPGFLPQGIVNELRRRAVDAHATVGYIGNQFDVKLGYEFYWLDFVDDFFNQANQISHAAFVEFGVSPASLDDKRIYTRFKYTDLHFRERYLNDAQVSEAILGFEGSLLSKKLRVVAEAGYMDWSRDPNHRVGKPTPSQPQGVPLTLSDAKEYRGGTALLRAVYMPIAGQNLRFQFEGRRAVEWSAISNYRLSHMAALTVSNEFSKRLDGDVTASWSHHEPTQGPVRTLWEIGAGVTYHLYKQVDLSARYLFRFQLSNREESLTSADPLGNPITIQTDGDFHQSVFSLGIEITF